MSSIRFPKQHIAASVVNRLLNVADGLEMDALAQPGSVRHSTPLAPTDTAGQGAALDQALATPPGATVPLDQAPDPGGTVAGKPLIATMLDPE